jgi:hypothetical protein
MTERYTRTAPVIAELSLQSAAACGARLRRLVSARPLNEEAGMFRTSRTFRRGRAAVTWVGEWRLTGPERRAARSERAAERQMRRERDNGESAAARAAALESEARRDRNFGGMI